MAYLPCYEWRNVTPGATLHEQNIVLFAVATTCDNKKAQFLLHQFFVFQILFMPIQKAQSEKSFFASGKNVASFLPRPTADPQNMAIFLPEPNTKTLS